MPAPLFDDRPVALALFGKPPREGVARVRIWRPGERVARTVKGLLVCWALAAAALFIPVAHFFLVPGFLIGGIVLAVRWSEQAETFEGASGVCPGCGREGDYSVRGKFALPKETSCAECRGRVILKAREEG